MLTLDGRSLAIFPCKRDKSPSCPRGHLAATSDPKSIERLFRLYPGPLIGVPSGAISGLDYLDIDLKCGGDRWFHEHHDRLPITRTHATPSGGWHLIFKHLPGLRTSADRIAPGVEVRANGSHIVWYPAHGGRVICDASPADFPLWVAELGGWRSEAFGLDGRLGVFLSELEERKITPRAPTRYQVNYANKALRNAAWELRVCDEGRRNHLLNVLSYKMGRLIANGWIGREPVEDWLLECCEKNGLIADDGIGQCRLTLASGLNAGMARPYHEIDSARLGGPA
jgi:hypothetical protein